MKLYIKNMVSLRCKMIVKSCCEECGISFLNIDLGELEIEENLPAHKIERFEIALRRYGLLLMDKQHSILIERIKSLVVEMVHFEETFINTRLPDYVSQKLVSVMIMSPIFFLKLRELRLNNLFFFIN